jgi:hypothetical protein
MESKITVNASSTSFQEGEAERAYYLLSQEDKVIDSIPYNLVKDKYGDDVLNVKIPADPSAKVDTAYRLMATAYRLLEDAADAMMEQELG